MFNKKGVGIICAATSYGFRYNWLKLNPQFECPLVRHKGCLEAWGYARNCKTQLVGPSSHLVTHVLAIFVGMMVILAAHLLIAISTAQIT